MTSGSFRAALLAESSAERRWRVAEISERLQAEAPAPQLGNMELSSEQRAALATHAACRERYRLGGESAQSQPQPQPQPQRASVRPALSAPRGRAGAAVAADAT